MKGAGQNKRMSCRMIVIGGSAGGLEAFEQILAELPPGFSLPLVGVFHLHASSDTSILVQRLNNKCRLAVVEAIERELPQPAHVYLAPPNYHLLIESDGRLALSIDEKVNYSRPSIDMLFSSAADAFGDALAAVILSGASRDGVDGLLRIKKFGGLTIAQDPTTAESPFMPQAAIKAGAVTVCLSPEQIGQKLRKIGAVSKPNV